MFIEGSKYKAYDPETPCQSIEAGTIDRTILGSDLGHIDNITRRLSKGSVP